MNDKINIEDKKNKNIKQELSDSCDKEEDNETIELENLAKKHDNLKNQLYSLDMPF